MNKKEQLLDVLTEKTTCENPEIVWAICPNSAASAYVPNPEKIVRVVGSTYKGTRFLFVEIKCLSYSLDEDICETVGSCVLVEKSDRLVMTIYPKEIADSIYEKFSNAIVANVENDFLNDFLRDETDIEQSN